MGGPITDNVYDYVYNTDNDFFVGGERYLLVIRDLTKVLDILNWKRLREQLK